MKDKTASYMTKILPNCMLTYQYIEESLRQCLYSYHLIIVMKIDGDINYNVPFDTIQSVAMGRLIHLFKQFNNDKEMIRLLKEVKTERDKIAHQGYLYTLDKQENHLTFEQVYTEAKNSLKKANECLLLVSLEIKRLDELGKEIHAKIQKSKANH